MSIRTGFLKSLDKKDEIETVKPILVSTVLFDFYKSKDSIYHRNIFTKKIINRSGILPHIWKPQQDTFNFSSFSASSLLSRVAKSWEEVLKKQKPGAVRKLQTTPLIPVSILDFLCLFIIFEIKLRKVRWAVGGGGGDGGR